MRELEPHLGNARVAEDEAPDDVGIDRQHAVVVRSRSAQPRAPHGKCRQFEMHSVA